MGLRRSERLDGRLLELKRRWLVRIASRGDGRCIGGFLSARSWLLVALMSGAGRLLRGGLLPLPVAGTLYVAIGTGLLFSSRIAWLRWRAAAP